MSEPTIKLSRRALLRASAGGALLMPGLGGTALAGVNEVRQPVDRASGESRRLAEFVASSSFDDLPKTAARMTRYSILDAIGVSMAATALEPACEPFIDLTQEEESDAAVIVGSGKRSSMIMAALGNGALAHALDYEDAHGASFTHPNAATVAAALAVADARGRVSGAEFIQAVALGCDVTVRLSLAQGNVGQLPVAYYPPAIVGTFGATAAASRLLGLDAGKTLSAFSLALGTNSHSAQILFSPYSDLRAVRDGFCAQTGVQSARLAELGVTGFEAPFEGKGGFFDMYADGKQSPGVLTANLGKHFAGTDIGFKAWPACRATHIYIQAILEALEQEAINADDIASIRAYVKESDMIVCEPAAEKRRPRAAIDAKFSLYYTLASALIKRRIDFASYTSDALQEAQVLQLGDRIRYELNEQRARPRAEGGGSLLEVNLRDGSRRLWGIDNLYGSPANPMSEAALVTKFIDCGLAARKPFTRMALESLAEDILSLDTETEMRNITRQL